MFIPHTRFFQREHHDLLQESVSDFMKKGGQTTDRFNATQACLYTGLQLEELAEKIAAIVEGTVTQPQREHMQLLRITLESFAKEFKQGMHHGAVLRADHAELIDADFDLAWVSVAGVFSTSTDAFGAIAHGTFTNMDKFRNGCVKDANGKIQKPADWAPPDFERYVDPTPKA